MDQVSLSLVYEAVVSGEILAICNCARQLLVSTEMGVIYRMDWDGRFDTQMSVYLNKLTFANDLLPTSRGDGDCVISASSCYPFLSLPARLLTLLLQASLQKGCSVRWTSATALSSTALCWSSAVEKPHL